MFEQLTATVSQPYFVWIKKLLEAHPSAEIFLVGGAVRDALLGRATKDYDFVVRGVQARHLQELLAKVGIVNLVGRTFGVYKFIPDEGYDEFKASGLEAFDVALPRTEHAWGTGGYRDVEVQSNHELPIEEDLGRRDFTINAMAIRLTADSIQHTALSIEPLAVDRKPLAVVDPFSGMKDIEAKIIRAVGDPKERFKEDYTRMVRGLRFACERGFAIEPATFEALKEVMLQINDVRQHDPSSHERKDEFVAPREVISREMLRAFYANPVAAFDLYDQSGAFAQLTPELLKMKGCPQPEEFHSEGDVWAHTRLALEALGSEKYQEFFGDERPNALTVMAVLFHDVGKPPMLRTPEEHGVDRIRFDEHDTVGAEMTREIAKRLVLSIMPIGSPFHVDPDKLYWLIKHHLVLLHTKAEDFKAATVEKYFFTEKNPGEELLRLMFCDGSASIPGSGTQGAALQSRSAGVYPPLEGKPNLQNLHDMIARIKRMESAVREKRVFVKPLINGDEIMAILKIPAGPGVGELLRSLREEQLSARVTTKESAIEWLKKSFE